MKARVYVTLKNGVLDPQGKAVEHSLQSIGYHGVGVRMGKYIELDLSGFSIDEKEQAEKQVREICEKLLANTVIETYRFEWV